MVVNTDDIGFCVPLKDADFDYERWRAIAGF